MKTAQPTPSRLYRPSEAAIREKAHEIYMRSGWVHGRDLDNWLEAEAWLTANQPTDDGLVQAWPAETPEEPGTSSPDEA